MQPIAGAVERQNFFDNYRQITCSGDKKWDFMGTFSKVGIYAAAFFGILWAGLTLSTIPAILVGVALGSAAIGLHMLFQFCVCPSGDFFRGSSYSYTPPHAHYVVPRGTYQGVPFQTYVPPVVTTVRQPMSTGQHVMPNRGHNQTAPFVRSPTYTPPAIRIPQPPATGQHVMPNRGHNQTLPLMQIPPATGQRVIPGRGHNQ